MNPEYIIDRGFSKIVGHQRLTKSISFEDISVIFSTLQEYRDYAIPETNSWNEYILDIFRVSSFHTRKLKEDCYSLAENNSQKPPNIVIIVVTNKDIDEIQKQKDINEHLSTLPDDHDFSWAIITDGFKMNVMNLSATNQEEYCLTVDFEKIIQDQRLDSFLTLYNALQTLHVSKNRKDSSAGSISSDKNIDESTNAIADFPTLSLLALYKKKFESLRINKNSKIWKGSTNFSAPHKPILLLSIIDIFDKYKNLGGVFIVNDELKDSFEKYWRVVLPDQPVGNIVLPFYHLQGDGIWNLRVNTGEEENYKSLPEIDSITMLNRLTDGASMHQEIFNFLFDDDYRTVLKMCMIEKYFSQELHNRLFEIAKLDFTKISKSQYLLENLRQESDKQNGLFQGFIEIPFRPNTPWPKLPTKEDCKDSEYLEIDQLAALARSFGRSRSYTISDFGGDNGYYYTLPERQTRVYRQTWTNTVSYKLHKYVLIYAVEDYVKKEGFDWK